MNALAFQTPGKLFSDYSNRLSAALQGFDWSPVERLAYESARLLADRPAGVLLRQWRQRR